MKSLLPLIALALTGCATTGAGQASAAAPGEETYIRYFGSPSDIKWRGGTDDTLYLQDIRRQWFRVTVTPPCSLIGAFAVSFRSTIPGRFERGDTIVSNQESCQVNSVVHMAGPPPEKARDKD